MLYEDRTGVVWAGLSEGLFRYEPESDSFQAFLHDEDDPRSLAAGVVSDIQQDLSGALWVLTSGTAETIPALNRMVHRQASTP